MRFTKEMIGFPVVWNYTHILGTIEEVTETSVVASFPDKGTFEFGLTGASEPGRSVRHARAGEISLFSQANSPVKPLFDKARDILYLFKCVDPVKSILFSDEQVIIRTAKEEWVLPFEVFSMSLYYIRLYLERLERLGEDKLTFLNH